MAQKTYLLGWLALLQKVTRYYGRWNAKMAANLNSEQQACVVAVANAVVTCAAAFGVRPVE